MRLDPNVMVFLLNLLLPQLDLNAVVSRLDFDQIVEKIDVNAIVERVDVDALVERTELGSIVARPVLAWRATWSTPFAAQASASTRSFIAGSIASCGARTRRVIKVRRSCSRSSVRRNHEPPYRAGSRHQPQGHYAGIVTRVAAFGIDVVVAMTLFTLAVRSLEYVLSSLIGRRVSLSNAPIISVIMLTLWLLIYFAYPIAVGGRTLGMAFVGLEVVTKDGGPSRRVRWCAPSSCRSAWCSSASASS